jgi:hypothetical protein
MSASRLRPQPEKRRNNGNHGFHGLHGLKKKKRRRLEPQITRTKRRDLNREDEGSDSLRPKAWKRNREWMRIRKRGSQSRITRIGRIMRIFGAYACGPIRQLLGRIREISAIRGCGVFFLNPNAPA